MSAHLVSARYTSYSLLSTMSSPLPPSSSPGFPLFRGATVEVLLFVLILVLVIWRLWVQPHPRPTLRSVAIVVLGDIGRSPRMMYHAESFATNGFQTYLIGQSGESFPRVFRVAGARCAKRGFGYASSRTYVTPGHMYPVYTLDHDLPLVCED